jgi:hypothetical protein
VKSVPFGSEFNCNAKLVHSFRAAASATPGASLDAAGESESLNVSTCSDGPAGGVVAFDFPPNGRDGIDIDGIFMLAQLTIRAVITANRAVIPSAAAEGFRMVNRRWLPTRCARTWDLLLLSTPNHARFLRGGQWQHRLRILFEAAETRFLPWRRRFYIAPDGSAPSVLSAVPKRWHNLCSSILTSPVRVASKTERHRALQTRHGQVRVARTAAKILVSSSARPHGL